MGANKNNNNNMLPIAKNIIPLINLLFLYPLLGELFSHVNPSPNSLCEILDAVFTKFYFLIFPFYFLPPLRRVPINKPIPAAMAIDKIGFSNWIFYFGLRYCCSSKVLLIDFR